MSVLPHVREALVDDKRRCTPAFYQFLRALSESANLDLAAQVEAIARALGSPDGSVDNIPPQTAGEFLSSATQLLGTQSVQVQGTLAGGLASVSLVGDVPAPEPTAYYGTDAAGAKGFHPVSDALVEGEGITLAVDAGGVTEIGLADLPDTGGGTLQRFERDAKGRVAGTSDATTDDLPEGSANLYHTPERAAAAAPVQSVNGQTGAVELDAGDVGAATAAQGALADSALQPGDAVSLLANDAGYVDAAGASAAAPVQSVVGQTGDISAAQIKAAVSYTAADVGADPAGSAAAAQAAAQSYADARVNAVVAKVSVARVSLLASGAVSALRAIVADGGTGRYPNTAIASDAGKVVGISVTAAADGEPFEVLTDGEWTDASWSWTPGAVFCGADGVLTQTPPSGWVLEVGRALSATRLIVDVKTPLVRA